MSEAKRRHTNNIFTTIIMPSKRPHTKTRHGCKTCRARRVRCDLQRPICGNCIKRKVTCAYLKEPAPDRSQQQQQPQALQLGASIAGPAGGSSGIVIPPFNAAAGFTTRDVQLMYHWSTSTYLTLSDDEERHEVWQRTVPELAFRHDFLLYGLFALAAFHRCRTMPAVSSTERAALIALGRHYKQWGLTSYIPLLQHSSDGNCHALFAFSLLLGSLCLGELQYDYEDASYSAMDFFTAMVGISNLMSGTVALANQHRPALREGNMAPLLGSDLQPGPIESFPYTLRQALELVLDAVRHDSPDLPSSDKEACLAALRRLGLLYPKGGHPTCTRAALIAWPVLGGRDFLDMMHARDPLALICLAHYGAILHQNKHVWFLDGLGAKLVTSVLEVIPVCAVKYLEWAVGTVRGGGEV